MGKVENKLLEIQPNSQQREELIIVINYLLKYAYDENHLVKTIDIVEYAKKEYNVEIRRDRIPQILIHLYQLSHDKSYQLPFVVEYKKLKSTMKFYVSKRKYEDKEIIDIISAIRNAETKSKRSVTTLIDKILNNNVPEDLKAEYLNKLKNRVKKPLETFVSSEYDDAINQLEELSDKKSIIVFNIASTSDLGYARAIKNKNSDNSFIEYKGVIYRIISSGSSTKLIVYLYEEENVIVIPIYNFRYIREVPSKKNHNFNYLVKKNKESISIDEWIVKFFSGQSGSLYKFEIRYSLKDKATANKIERSFKKYYSSLKYEIFTKVDTTNNEEYKHIKFSSNIESFNNWYLTYFNLQHVDVLSPKSVNDSLLSFASLLINKINTLGEKHSLDVSVKIRDEYLKNMDKVFSK